MIDKIKTRKQNNHLLKIAYLNVLQVNSAFLTGDEFKMLTDIEVQLTQLGNKIVNDLNTEEFILENNDG